MLLARCLFNLLLFNRPLGLMAASRCLMGKLPGNDESRNYLSFVVLRASWAYITRGYNHHHSSSRIFFGSNLNCVSRQYYYSQLQKGSYI